MSTTMSPRRLAPEGADVRLSVHTRLRYEVRAPTTFIFMVQAGGGFGETILSEDIELPPGVEADFIVGSGAPNRLVRFLARPGEFDLTYRAEIETAGDRDQRRFVGGAVINDLPADVLPYLSPSRYCQSDLLTNFARSEFGGFPQGLGQVQAVTDWIFNRITYCAASSPEGTSALDTLVSRAGVCRDFAHLGAAICRALDLPARIVSCYAWKLEPPDFHAVFQVFLDGAWITFDATRLAPLEGLVHIASGRDAADVPFSAYFGQATLIDKQIEVSEA
ncbi:MAG: transglutaminase family protein [Caulobacteraceae bacterium]|nr:MAG: transglutaminase family protein [Caulobacteraceae bacterium]